ncbi:MAG: methyltransferase domain-containing protein [Ginsengibacter sp.]
MRPKNYQDNFFDFHLQDSINSAKEIIPLVLEYIKPASVIDVGCGVGTWLSIWEKHGVNDILGIDGSYVYPELLIEKDRFIIADLEEGFKINRQFELVSCLEVAEHIRQRNAENFITSICNIGDIILFSAAIPGQEGTLHYNEQYPNYWIELFAKHNFTAYDCIRPQVWANAKISWWYRQNIMFFIRDNAKEKYPLIIKAQHSVLSMVHPELFKYKSMMVTDYEKILRNPFSALRYFAGSYLNKIKKLLKR